MASRYNQIPVGPLREFIRRLNRTMSQPEIARYLRIPERRVGDVLNECETVDRTWADSVMSRTGMTLDELYDYDLP